MKRKKSNGKRKHAFQAQSQDMETAFVRLVEYLIAGLWSYISFSIVRSGETCLIAIRRSGCCGQTERQPQQIRYAGAASTEMAFVGKHEVPDLPPKELKEWLREWLQDHIAVVSETLLICIPTELLGVLITADLPEEQRKSALQEWDKDQYEHELCEDCLRELRETDSLTGFAVKEVCSDEYTHNYLQSLKIFTVASVWLTGMSPWKVCACTRKAQVLSAECPHRFTGDGKRDASLVGKYLGLTSEALEEAYDRIPNIFQILGWHRDSVPDED